MMKLCEKCNEIVTFNSYFNAYICDHCNYREVRGIFAEGYECLYKKLDEFYANLNEKLDNLEKKLDK